MNTPTRQTNGVEPIKVRINPSDTTVGDVLAHVRCGEPVEHLALVVDGAILPPTTPVSKISDGSALHVICTRRTPRLPPSPASSEPPQPTALTWPLSTVTRALSRSPLSRRPLEAVVPSTTALSLLRPPVHHETEDISASDESSDGEPTSLEPTAAPRSPRKRHTHTGAAAASAAAREAADDEPPADCLDLEWVCGFSPDGGLLRLGAGLVV